MVAVDHRKLEWPGRPCCYVSKVIDDVSAVLLAMLHIGRLQQR